MKVSLVHTSLNTDMPDSQREKAQGSWPPLGILYVATFLREHGIDVSVLDQDAKNLSPQKTLEWIERERPDVLGFSTLNGSGKMASTLATKVKRERPDVKIVFGNYFPTFNAERLLKKYSDIDFIVCGEGEETALELTKKLDEDFDTKDLSDVRGLAYRGVGGDIIKTYDRPLIENVDELPFPDRSLIDVEYRSTLFGINIATKRFTTVLTSRGCTFDCNFCGCSTFARRRWRARSPENVLDEMRELVAKDYKQFLFVDDHFTLNEKRAMKICDMMHDEKMDIEWICESRVDRCTDAMMRALVRGGCHVLYLGIECGTQRMLDYYNKKTTPHDAERAVSNAREAGIDVIVGTFVLGGYDETKEEIQQTLDFAKKLDIDVPQFNILYAFPGIKIWEDLRRQNLINVNESWETGICVSEISDEGVPFDEIRTMIQENFKEFFLRPRYISKEIYRTLRSPYRKSIVRNAARNLDGVRAAFAQASKTW